MAILGQSMCLSNFLSHLLFCHSRGQRCPYHLAPEKPLITWGFHQLETYLSCSRFTASLMQRLPRSGPSPTEYFSFGWSCFQCFLVFQWLKVKSGAGDWINKALWGELRQWHVNPSPEKRKPPSKALRTKTFKGALNNLVLTPEKAKVYECVCVCDESSQVGCLELKTLPDITQASVSGAEFVSSLSDGCEFPRAHCFPWGREERPCQLCVPPCFLAVLYNEWAGLGHPYHIQRSWKGSLCLIWLNAWLNNQPRGWVSLFRGHLHAEPLWVQKLSINQCA